MFDVLEHKSNEMITTMMAKTETRTRTRTTKNSKDITEIKKER